MSAGGGGSGSMSAAVGWREMAWRLSAPAGENRRWRLSKLKAQRLGVAGGENGLCGSLIMSK